MAKRLCDIVVALLVLLALLPVFLTVALAIELDSEGPVFFKQQRIGRGFRPFFIYKFRTMVRNAPKLGGPITVGDDPRVTRAGRFLRRFKIDELPQLINVLKGDMSLVGPRPELREYVDAFRGDYEQILAIRPGLTDLASLKFIDEAGLLAQATDPERAYRECVLPEKLALAKQYVRDQSLQLDFLLLARTVRGILRLSAIM
jgi:lipopolysaccharide/colanic/teichoic acid biosynthesis glycosyltransferase